MSRGLPAGWRFLPATRPAAAPDDGLPRAAPEDVGLSSAAILDLLDALDAAGIEMHSLLIARCGAVAAEGWWWPYSPDRVHMLHSVTKALTATGIGLALAAGLFSLDDPVLSFFPDKVPADASVNLRAMRVRHLLTQTSGHDRGVSVSVWRSIRTSWIDEFLKIPVPHAPGTHFQYSSATSFMLSAIVSRTAGVSLHDFLVPRLFAPLGMQSVRWDVGPEGINPGGNGVSATSADLLKLGLLHAADGVWNGRRILPEGWVKAAGSPAFGNRYGHHWWVMPEEMGLYAFGAFGQYAFVFPASGLVIVTTAAVPGSISKPDIGIPPLIWAHAPRLLASSGTRPDAAARLRYRLAGLALPAAAAMAPPGRTGTLHFAPAENADDVRAVTLHLSDDFCRFVLETGRGPHEVVAGFGGRWVEGETSMPGLGLHHGYEPPSLRVAAAAHWASPAQLELECRFVETAFRDRIVLRCDEDTARYDRCVNVNGGATERPGISLRRTA